MNTMNSSRRWRVAMVDGSVIEFAGIKLIETDVGSLLVVGRDREPTQLVAAGQWVTCDEITSARGGAR